MTTKHMFKLAYSAARRAERMNDRDSDGWYRSPLQCALDATWSCHSEIRYPVCVAAWQIATGSVWHRKLIAK